MTRINHHSREFHVDRWRFPDVRHDTPFFFRLQRADLGGCTAAEKVSEASSNLLCRPHPRRTVALDLVVTNVCFVHI